MEKELVLKEASRIKDMKDGKIMVIQSKEFIRRFAGKNTELYTSIMAPFQNWKSYEERVRNIMQSFITFTENGVLKSISFEREVQIETVSEYLNQANKLLCDKQVHPAASVVIISASLEAFLRTWLEEEKFDLSTIKNSLDAYAKELKKMKLINKQDLKDIASWSDIRKAAAHGQFKEVKNRSKIKMMLEGVNLFMRKYSPN